MKTKKHNRNLVNRYKTKKKRYLLNLNNILLPNKEKVILKQSHLLFFLF